MSGSYARQPEPVTPAGPIVCTWDGETWKVWRETYGRGDVLDEWVQVVDVPLVQTGEGTWTSTFTQTLT